MKIEYQNGPLDHICIGGNSPITDKYPDDGDFRAWLIAIHFRHPFLVGHTLCGVNYDKDIHGELNTLKPVTCTYCKHMFNTISKSK